MKQCLNTFAFYAAIILLLAGCNSDKKTEENKTTAEAVSTNSNADPLPSWNEGANKKAIIDFVKNTTTEGGTSFIKPEDRIATFDNDGTLWAEQPLYFQLFFSIDRIKELSPQNPEWKIMEPFRSILTGDIKKALASGEKGIATIMSVASAGMTGDEYDRIVKEWVATARHPISKKAFTEMIYQPMLELLVYLRNNGFKTFIVSGGDIDFMRAWAEKVYGIPPQQVVGSSMKLSYELKDSVPVINRLPELNFIDDGPGKPIGIYNHIGKRPVFAAGNSDGDYQMLQWTTTGTGPRMGIIVHHTDSTREWAYDRNSHIGRLDKGLNDAGKYGWKLIDMKNDWKKIFPGER